MVNNSATVSGRLIATFVICLVLTLIWYFVMSTVGKPLTSKQIVAFELARTTEAASVIIQDWKQFELVDKARQSIYLDFIFLVLYSLTLSFSCLISSRLARNNFFITAGLWLSRTVLLAGLFDLIENVAMLRTLAAGPTQLSVGIAYWFASAKFLMIGAVIFFVLCGFVFGGISRMVKK